MNLRVIAGSAKGTKLESLDGSKTRPTLDRVKESLFGGIQYELRGARCLDAFAGSGQLGIEALSRGASYVDFCEIERDAFKILKHNVEKCGFTCKSGLWNSSVFKHLEGSVIEPYDFVFLDPPYGKNLIVKMLEVLQFSGVLGAKATIVCEVEKSLQPKPDCACLQLKKQKHFSRSTLLFYGVLDKAAHEFGN